MSNTNSGRAPITHTPPTCHRHATSSAAVVLACLILIAAGCGGSSKKAVGPDVRGMALPNAEMTLKKAGIGYSEKADDGLFGIVVKQNWQVCSEDYVNQQMVTLHVKKYGC